MTENPGKARLEALDFLRGWAITAVILDHLKVVPEPAVVWPVNLFVLLTAAVYSVPGYRFTAGKLFLKLAHLVFIYKIALLSFTGLFRLKIYEFLAHPSFKVLLSPHSLFVNNPYLGDIWYITLHLQILVLTFFFLKSHARLYAGRVFLISTAVTLVSFTLSHFFGRFHTIFVSAWLFYLAAGFYGMMPLLNWIRLQDRHRKTILAAASLVILLVYSQYSRAPWAFTNENRALPILLPLYIALVFFFGELFYLMERSAWGRFFNRGVALIGRYTLAIYLTHHAFALAWGPFFPSLPVRVFPVLLSSLAFGILAGRIFVFFQKKIEKARGYPPEAARPLVPLSSGRPSF